MKRASIIVILIVFALVFAFTVPVLPKHLPPEVWKDSDFETLKPRIEEAAEKLNRMTFDLTEAGHKPPMTYNLIGRFGHTNCRHTVLGNWSFGTTRQSTWAFGTWMLPGVPHLDYDHEAKTVQVTPENVRKFLEWAETATSYPGAPNPRSTTSRIVTTPTSRPVPDAVR